MVNSGVAVVPRVAGRDFVCSLDRATLQAQAARPLTATPRPFVRWAGSKQRLLPHLIDALPDTFGRYYEPFLGSAALFFLLAPERAVLTDACLPLVQVYEALRTDVDRVLELLSGYDVLDKEMYYAVRAVEPEDLHERAARFLYLNRACWNGLYRVNGAGRFNVPYGAPKTGALPDDENLRACAQALARRGVTVRHGDFGRSVAGARAGDLVFFDPPYVTGHNNNGFIDYNEKLFRWADQERLAAVARRLVERGVFVMVTNAYHDRVLALYPGFEVRVIERSSTLANNKAFRRPVSEALLCGQPR